MGMEPLKSYFDTTQLKVNRTLKSGISHNTYVSDSPRGNTRWLQNHEVACVVVPLYIHLCLPTPSSFKYSVCAYKYPYIYTRC